LAGTPLLGARLARWAPAAERARRLRQPASAWSATFQGLLAGLGWPGERALDSEEFQTFDKWREVVAGLSALDLVSGSLRFEEALAALRRLAADTLFQPESEGAPVQVLGVLEATALEFDHLFVTGLTDEALPASPRPNPFLPIGLQRRLGVPHASAEWETKFARQALWQWRAAAPRVSLSYPSQDSERALRGSPLLTGIPQAALQPALPFHRDAVFAARAIEPLADFTAPPLAPGAHVGGGASFFKNQADCPFRAFAVHRLGAQALEAGHAGLDARERGTLAHEAAAALWRELKTHARLDAMNEEEMARAAESAAAAAVRRMRGERPDVMTEAFGRLEQERLARLLAGLLRVEQLRAPFEVVACEERRPIALGGVEVNVRVDRIDGLENGTRVILDYKTGRARSTARWLDERPDELQLPLYVVTDAGEVAAAAFVALNARDTGFRGIARAEGVLPGVQTVEQAAGGRYTGWSELTAAWRRALEKLAAEYLSGAAPVAPRDYPRTCEYCDIKTLCRVRELLDRGPVVEPGADAGVEGAEDG
ncbi:MAG: PD-(D/E)XK nuclease family protein, partial [Burkholderiales bacterium]